MSDVAVYLPKNTPLTVKEGDEVTFGQKLSREEAANIVYDLRNLLSIEPKDIARVVLKKEGDVVRKGDVLVKKRSFFSTKFLKATFNGKVVRIDEQQGRLEVSPNQVEKAGVVSPVAGKVKKVTNEEVIIEYKGIIVFAKQGIGRIKRGVLHVLSKATEDVTLSDIRGEHKNAVLLGGHFTRQVLEKAFGIGAASVVVALLDEGDVAYFAENKLFDASVLLVSSAEYDTVKEYEGKEVVVEGVHKRLLA